MLAGQFDRYSLFGKTLIGYLNEFDIPYMIAQVDHSTLPKYQQYPSRVLTHSLLYFQCMNVTSVFLHGINTQ